MIYVPFTIAIITLMVYGFWAMYRATWPKNTEEIERDMQAAPEQAASILRQLDRAGIVDINHHD